MPPKEYKKHMSSITYRSIVAAIVERELTAEVEKMAGSTPSRFIWAHADNIELENDRKNGWVSFTCNLNVRGDGIIYGGHDYRANGYVDERGHVRFCGLDFERTYCVLDENGDWDHETTRKERFYLWGDKLEAFKFDK